MVARLSYAASVPPPWWSPEGGYVLYLPEDAYFRDQPEFPLALFARTTARILARWADQYETALITAAQKREGALPDAPEARVEVITTLFDELAAQADEPWMICFSLQAAGRVILQQFDGLPGTLYLSEGEYSAVQDAWAQAGFPRDAYYPLSERRGVEEPVLSFGGVLRQVQYYSPRRWARRDHEAIRQLRIPTESERQERWLESASQFIRALNLRTAELQEADGDSSREEVVRLRGLGQMVSRIVSQDERIGSPQ